jgi:lactoylglutathione lyase
MARLFRMRPRVAVVGYSGGRTFGHVAYELDDIYCRRPMDGVTINRPPRDGHMAFVPSPDGISFDKASGTW